MAIIKREIYVYMGDKKMVPYNFNGNWLGIIDDFLRQYPDWAGPIPDGYSPPPDIEVSFSQNNKNFAVHVSKKGKAYLICKDKEFGPFDGVGYVRFTDDEDVITFVGRINKQKYICKNEEKYGPFDSIVDFSFSHDNKIYACMSLVDKRKNYNFYLTIGNEKIGPLKYPNSHPLHMCQDGVTPSTMSIDHWVTFFPQGSNYLYKTCDANSYGKEVYIHFGKEKLGPFKLIEDDIVFSDNNQDFAFIVSEGEEYFNPTINYIVHGQERMRPYEAIS